MASEATRFVLSSGPYKVDYTACGWSGPTLVLTTPDGARTFTGAQLTVRVTTLGTEVEVQREAYPTWKRLFTLVLPAPVMVDATPVAVIAIGIFTDVQSALAAGEAQKYETVRLQGTADRGREANHLALQGPAYKIDLTVSAGGARTLVVQNPDGPRSFGDSKITTSVSPIGTELTVPFDNGLVHRTLSLFVPTVLVAPGGSVPVITFAVFRDLPSPVPIGPQNPSYDVMPLQGTANQV